MYASCSSGLSNVVSWSTLFQFKPPRNNVFGQPRPQHLWSYVSPTFTSAKWEWQTVTRIYYHQKQFMNELIRCCYWIHCLMIFMTTFFIAVVVSRVKPCFTEVSRFKLKYSVFQKVSHFCYASPLIGGALSNDAVWRLSVTYIEPKSRTERPRKTKIGTEVTNVTRDSDTTFKVKRSKVKITRPLYSPWR